MGGLLWSPAPDQWYPVSHHTSHGRAVTATLHSTLSAIAELARVALASSMSEGVRTALLALLGLLVVIFGCLIAFAFVLRRRPPVEVVDADKGEDNDPVHEHRLRRVLQRDPRACPVCRREFDSHLRFCPYDATSLIPAPQMLDRIGDPSRTTSVCPTCRRAFEGKVRFCPHDGSDLVSASLTVGHGHSDGDDDHEGVKICPECRDRYGFAASFCGKDGVQLVVLN
jgi:RNA polymerase subunit RPABC4/transcription elongation factor Spt4